jgi:hypothetical protein
MKRKVFCNQNVCALDRLPEQQFGGGLRVQSPDYVVPLSSPSPLMTQVGKGRIRRRSPQLSKLTRNKRSCSGKFSISRKRTTVKKSHGK